MDLLGKLTVNDASRGTMLIPPLFKILRDPQSPFVAESAMRILGKLAGNKDTKTALIEAGVIPLLGELLLSDFFSEKASAATMLSELKFPNVTSPASIPVVIKEAADVCFASASEERRAAKARVRELESELADLKRKLPAKNGG